MQKSFLQNVTSNPNKNCEETKKEGNLNNLIKKKNFFSKQAYLIYNDKKKNWMLSPQNKEQRCPLSLLLTTVVEASSSTVGKINKTSRERKTSSKEKSKTSFI